MSKAASFEKTLADLERIVQQLEQGDLSLDESLKQFEKGVKLARSCQTALSDAELKIKTITEANSTMDAEPLGDE
ncbi:MAG: exodeoxyribonuclease VII small subunit [Legionellaceae bacterium]|nr:exodeoxyribonuclease VII small subunit [Legionellaceae bacterium]